MYFIQYIQKSSIVPSPHLQDVGYSLDTALQKTSLTEL